MQLETITIKNFRSVEFITLSDCGGFNVLIGKNNAGKSNILLGINLFFEALRRTPGVVVFPGPTSAVDHFKEDTKKPISLSFDFRLSLAERDSLIQDIVSTAPQVKHAVEGMDPNLRLGVTVACVSAPTFAYVQEIVLHKQQFGEKAQSDDSTRAILRIDREAAAELGDRARQASKHQQDVEFIRDTMNRIERFGADDWDRVRTDPSRFLRMFHDSPRGQSSADVWAKFDRLIRSSENRAAAKEGIEGMVAGMEREVNEKQSLPLENRIESISGKETTVPAYALRLVSKLAEAKVLFLRERREPIGQKEAEQLLNLKVTRGGPEKLRAIQETVEALLGVEIDAFKASGKADSPAELDVDKFLVQGNGAGIREALRLILDYEFSQPEILLVEEPEVHLHPALEISMMRYLKRTGRECQIFITTHSTNFLDTAEMRNVYLVSRDTSTNVQLINVAEAEAVIPRELGLRLSSLFMFDKLVFVEGPSDEDVIREWASVLDINLAQASVGFVPMGGVRNLAHFATEKTLEFLTKRRVTMWFVLDRDEREEQEIKHLANHLGDHAVLKVLERREIENYLAVSRPLVEFVKLKRELGGSSGGIPDEKEIAKALDECAEALKEIALERRILKWACVPYYVNRQALLGARTAPFLEQLRVELDTVQTKLSENLKNLSTIVKDNEASFETRWAADKLKLVPGDLLLDEVCKRFGVRFIKEKDSARLAALMRKDEVSPDIRALIEQIRDKKLKA